MNQSNGYIKLYVSGEIRPLGLLHIQKQDHEVSIMHDNCLLEDK